MNEAAAEGLEIEGNQSRYDQTEEEEQDKETFDDWAERIAEEYERKRKVYAQYWGHTKHAPKRTATGTIFNSSARWTLLYHFKLLFNDSFI